MRLQLLIRATVVSLAVALVPWSNELRDQNGVASIASNTATPGSVGQSAANGAGESGPHKESQLATRDITGSLVWALSQRDIQSFNYITSTPNPRNWIAVYPATGGGPDNEAFVSEPLAWANATGQYGRADISSANLPRGQYKAYFLADQGYRWLAQPIRFDVTGPWGSLFVRTGDSLFTFQYSTLRPDSRNWIGVFLSYGGGPEAQRRVEEPAARAYAPYANGIVRINTSDLQVGLVYRVFFLAQDGYTWLANPIDIFNPGQGPLRFITDQFTTRNARQDEYFEVGIQKLLDNPPDLNTRFAKPIVSSNQYGIVSYNQTGNTADDWVKVSPDGVISGTPPTSAGNTTLVVEARSSTGSTAQLKVTIPVIQKDRPMVEQLTVLTLNLWAGGTRVRNFHAKQVRFISDSGADIVALQQSTGGHAIRLGKALGWRYWQGTDVGIISRYPILQEYSPIEAAGSVRIGLDQGHEINFWNMQLSQDSSYGPYDVCFGGQKEEQVLQNEERSKRTPQIRNILDKMRGHLDQSGQFGVILAGDAHAPSHLDWINETKDLHCGTGYIPWATSRLPAEAGLMDSYRQAHPDPLSAPGNTWSPIHVLNQGRPEPKDRIDFVYHKGLETLSSEMITVGQPRPEPDQYDNEWTSDHNAVRSVFRVNRDGFVQGGNSHVPYAVIAVMLIAAVATGLFVLYFWHRRRKLRKSGAAAKGKGKAGPNNGGVMSSEESS